MDARTIPIIEALIFSAEQPVTVAFIREILTQRMSAIRMDEGEDGPLPMHSSGTDETELWEGLTEEAILEVIAHLTARYEQDQSGFEIRKIAGGYQFFTKRAYFPYIRKASLSKQRKRLSRSALETLSIIAYRQPITKAEVEFIRGVNCDYAVQKLLEKRLIDMAGRADAPGRPMLYITSPNFLTYFGIHEISDLPKLKEFDTLAEDQLDQYRQGNSAPLNPEMYEPKEKDKQIPGILGEDQPAETPANQTGDPGEREQP